MTKVQQYKTSGTDLAKAMLIHTTECKKWVDGKIGLVN